MSEVRFYHLERQTMEQVLPALLSKALAGGRRVVVKAANEGAVARLNQYLWTYDPNSFLPHGSAKDGNPERQPVWLTAGDENPNGADALILTGGAESALIPDFSLCCDIFDGRDTEALTAARARWKRCKEAGYDVTYWQQGEKGWEKKAG